MHIVCPHCTTSYAIDLATLGSAGRTVRCSRCKEVWLARREDAFVSAMAAAGQPGGQEDATAEWETLAREEAPDEQTPHVDSPSISADWPAQRTAPAVVADWTSAARHDAHDHDVKYPKRARGFSRLLRLPAFPPISGKPAVSLAIALAATGAVVLALLLLRYDAGQRAA